MQSSATPPPSQGPLVAEAPTAETSPVKQFFQDWLVYRIPTGLAWIWFLRTYFGLYVPVDNTLLTYLTIPFLGVLVILFATGRWSRFFSYPLYLVFFPLVVILMPLVFVTSSSTAKRVSKGLWSLFTFIRSFKFILILIGFNIAFWIAAIYNFGAEKGLALTLTAHIITYLLFLQSFRWAANPYKPILAALEWASKGGAKLIHKLLIEPNLKKKLQERASAYGTCQQFEEGLRRLYDRDSPLTRGITSITHGGLSAIFIGVFFSMYLLTSLSFATCLMALEEGWGRLINGLGEAPNWLDYLYFTFLTQATAIPDGVSAIGHTGQLWIAWMVSTGLLLLTGLITLFTSSAGTYIESSLDEVDEIFSNMNQTLRRWEFELSDVPILDDNQKFALVQRS
jgi:hypothetical protein